MSTSPQDTPASVAENDLAYAIADRDHYHATADELAEMISKITGVDIGEHSSSNLPWYNALDAAKEWIATPPAQPAPVQEPVVFLANGTRFKISYDSRQSGGQIHGIPPELGGRWVAFVAADDDCHLKLTTPPAQPATVLQQAYRTSDAYTIGFKDGQAAQPKVPEGWKLVPIEPTQEMLEILPPIRGEDVSRELWANLLAAAPKAKLPPPNLSPLRKSLGLPSNASSTDVYESVNNLKDRP